MFCSTSKHINSGDSNFATTIKEKNYRYTTVEKDQENGISSRFKPIDAGGASAIRVQNLSNGSLGRPVEFESELNVNQVMNFILILVFHCVLFIMI